VQRGDGRWQVHIRHTDEDGRSRRYTVYGSTPKEARAKASAVRERLRANLPARDQRQGETKALARLGGQGGVTGGFDATRACPHTAIRGPCSSHPKERIRVSPMWALPALIVCRHNLLPEPNGGAG
jgi:hypothetical protein